MEVGRVSDTFEKIGEGRGERSRDDFTPSDSSSDIPEIGKEARWYKSEMSEFL